MLTKKSISRRGFLKTSGTISGVSLLKIGAPALTAIAQAACSAKNEAAPFAVLGADEAADLAAIAARILPTTDTPGASEAGVIYFFDRALAAEMKHALGPLRDGLASLNVSVSAAHPDAARFADLADEAQDALLTDIENSGFFNLTWALTMFGFFGMSQHGGNKDNIAWDLIGFEGNHGAWEYPFGHYDAEYAKEKADG
jgi:gluconate 2-dehydrogenase gamma chain